MKKNKNEHEIDLNKYEDLEGLSLKEMNFGLWLSENRAKITKLIIIILIFICAGFFIYSSYHYVVYFLNSSSEEGINSNITVSAPRNIVSEIKTSIPQVFKNGEAYDLVTLITNPNNKFIAHFEYCFTVNDAEQGCSSGFVLPAEEKYLFSLGQKIETANPEVNFKITNIFWQRVDSHKIPDWTSFANNRLNFNLKNINLVLAKDVNLSEKAGFDYLEFNISNDTAFGYYEVPLNIAFYSGSELIGVNKYVIKDFLAGEERVARLNWLGNLSGVTRTEIRPELNILDDSIYLKYQGVN